MWRLPPQAGDEGTEIHQHLNNQCHILTQPIQLSGNDSWLTGEYIQRGGDNVKKIKGVDSSPKFITDTSGLVWILRETHLKKRQAWGPPKSILDPYGSLAGQERGFHCAVTSKNIVLSIFGQWHHPRYPTHLFTFSCETRELSFMVREQWDQTCPF